jgi:uncharacterized protein YndB with AHSA1/START domain
MPLPSFTYTRVVDAPRKLVFLVHTDPVHLAKWMGPGGARIVRAEMDLRPGGSYHYGLVTAEGVEMWGLQQYLEIVPNEKIVLLQSFSDPQRGLARHPLSATWPVYMHATTEFEDAEGGKTRVTVTWHPHEADDVAIATFDAARSSMSGGFGGMFDTLDRYLAETAAQITHSRHFAAPRERVWQAFTDPAQVNLWWGPEGFRNVDVEQEVRVGGAWRFKMIGPDGTVYPNEATYVEITPPERLVLDHGDGTHVLFRSTITLTEEGGGTRVTMAATFADRAVRDGVVPYAIEGGKQSLRKLEQALTG